MSIKTNIARIKELECIIESHQVGGRLKYEGDVLRVIFFDTWDGFSGVQISLAKGKINALTICIKKLDGAYNKENGWRSSHVDLDSLNPEG